MNKTLILVVVMLGCGGRVSLGDHGSGRDNLTGMQDPAGDAAAWTDGGAASADPSAADGESVVPVLQPGDIAFVEVDELFGTERVHRSIRVDASCRVTDHTGLDTMGDMTRCNELFDVAVDPTTYGCGPQEGLGTVTLRMKDGRTFVRDLSADRCSVVIPGLPTHKHVYAVWGTGGG
jgi:hypothetical protein